MDLIDIANFKDINWLAGSMYGFLSIAFVVGFGAGWFTDPEKRLR